MFKQIHLGRSTSSYGEQGVMVTNILEMGIINVNDKIEVVLPPMTSQDHADGNCLIAIPIESLEAVAIALTNLNKFVQETPEIIKYIPKDYPWEDSHPTGQKTQSN